MTREEAARVLEGMMVDYRISSCDNDWYYGKNLEALETAITALRQPGWVKTADRVPTWEDAPHGYVANAWSYDENPHREDFTITGVHIRQIEKTDNPNDFWFALPPLPETVGSEPAKVPERILYPEKYCNLCNKALKHQSPPISYYFNNLPLCFECMKIVSAHH